MPTPSLPLSAREVPERARTCEKQHEKVKVTGKERKMKRGGNWVGGLPLFASACLLCTAVVLCKQTNFKELELCVLGVSVPGTTVTI